MPGDIRSFFGGKPTAVAGDGASDKKGPIKRSRNKKVVDDSDDEAPAPKKSTPSKATSNKKRAPSPEGEATTTSEYFGSKKPKKSAAPGKARNGVPAVEITPKAKESPVKASPKKATPSKATPSKATPSKPQASKSASTPNGRGSARSRKTVNYKLEDDDEDDVKMLEDDDDEKDDVFTADYKNGGRGGDDYEEDEDMQQVKAEEDEDDNEEQDVKPAKGKKAAPAKGGRKRKSEALDDDDEDQSPKKAKTPRKTKPKEVVEENANIQAIYDSIPKVRAPTPPPKDGDEGKRRPLPPGAHANSGPAPQAGSKDIPVGNEGCLAGLTFVFTGLLETISRDDGQALVKRYGGKVTGAPSKKTDFVVIGGDAGPKKLEKIRELSIKTINEDGLFELIRRLPPAGGDSKAGMEHQAKQAKEEEKIRKMAAEEEAKEQKLKKEAAKNPPKTPTGGARANDKAPAAGPDSRLWTVKHAPSALAQICGNKAVVERLQKWLSSFQKNARVKFKLGGPDGSGAFRAVMLHGPPGIGKTTAAHLVAKLEGYDVVETNASDTRSKKLVEAGLKGVLSTTSLLGYFAGDEAKVEASKQKLVLIMDEVDGMSAGDRGGVGALAAVCRKSQIPIILICNDRRLPKMKPFDHVTFDMGFRRPSVDQIRGRIKTIAFREGINLPTNVIDALIEGSRADIRQVVNMLSSIKLDQEAEGAAAFDFDSSKQMSKAWEKHVVLKSWDTVSKILGGGLFASTSNVDLNGKAALYFNDHDIAPLMLQENYLNTNPISTLQSQGREKNLKHLELAEKAASSISDGDLVDRMIHGSEQHWALMPTHAIFSFVRPASFVAGSQGGHQTTFPQWLGKNSTQGKLQRMVKEIQGHMRLRASGDRHEIRQQYLPLLWASLVKRLEVEGKDIVPEVIELMDSYFLTKDDWDAILELGVGPMDQGAVKLESQTKATFTRLYNQASHPLPFMKASNVIQPKKAAKEKPDIEEALEESDEGEVVEEAAEEKPDAEDNDLSKDKYVKQPKKKKAPAAAKGKGKAAAKKGGAGEDDDEDEGDGEDKPKKAPAKGKGRAKK